MRIGAPVFGWTDPESWALKHVEHGYGACYFPLNSSDEPALIDAYASAAARHGLVIAEIGVWNNLFDRDPVQQKKNFDHAVAQLRLADTIGAQCCVNISGSLGDTWDGPHPDNLSEKTYLRVVESVRAIIDAAQPKRTWYTLEPMPWMFPHSIEDMARLIRDVDREHFAVHVDLCNMVNSFDMVYNTGKLVRDFFREFGPLIRVVHAKDTVLGNKLTLHIGEAIPGDGLFDYDTLLSACDALYPDLPVMAEHLETEAEYLKATGFMQNKAKELGLHPLQST